MDDEAGLLANGSTADALETLRWDWSDATNPDGLDLAIKKDHAVRPVRRDAGAQR